MIIDVKTIILDGFNGNCYLLKTENGYVLIDTGGKFKRKKLEQELVCGGCKPGDLNLIILTHGDFDHTGNCVYLREKYHTKIAMHKYDIGMVEYGDMFWNRQTGNRLIKKVINVLFNIERFKPDVELDEQSDLSEYGLNAKILYLPGHSKGSIGILTSDKNLFCGDLFTNRKKPAPNSLVDNMNDFNERINKVKSFTIHTVYPGHGKLFQMDFHKYDKKSSMTN
jgi:glyoxylase-like metal-dependent hydrolase (beta-lactamase superfamily II)